jgi:hypothetical protein
MTKKLVSYKYLGGGFLVGIPARDLTVEEVKELEVKEAVEASPLYQKVYAGQDEKQPDKE